MFSYRRLTPQEAREAFDAYVGGFDERYEAFLSHLEAMDGPLDAVHSGVDGLVEVWTWFWDTYAERGATPLADAGVQVTRYHWFDSPQFDDFGDEGTTMVSGIAAWVVRLMEESLGRKMPWRLAPPDDAGRENAPLIDAVPVIRPDFALGTSLGRLRDGISLAGRQPEFLLRQFEKWMESEFLDGSGPPPDDGTLFDPLIHFEDLSLREFEVEIEFDPRVDWARRERFDEALAAESLVQRLGSRENIGGLVVRRVADEAEFEAMVLRVWAASE